MASHSFQLDQEAGRAADRGDDADRQILDFERGPLLDMQLEVGEKSRRVRAASLMARARDRTSSIASRIVSRPVVSRRARMVEGPGHRAAAEQGIKPHAFLVRERDDLDRERQAKAAPGDRQRIRWP